MDQPSNPFMTNHIRMIEIFSIFAPLLQGDSVIIMISSIFIKVVNSAK